MADVAVVTGAASGIGRALAAAMVARGHTVVLTDIDPDVDQVAAEMDSRGPGRAEGRRLDVRDAEAVRDVVESAAAQYGRLDLLFNNAGIGVGGAAEELTLAHWDRALDVNVRGVIHGVQAAYPLMVAQGSGHIVNTASLAGLIPSPLLAPYSMSKHAVVGLSLSLRIEAAALGVRVSALCPGVIETPILDKGNPADLPDVAHELAARDYLVRTNRPYDVDALATDALRGVARNDAVIVAPRSAHVQWWIQRLAPGLVAKVGRDSVAWAREQAGATAESVRAEVRRRRAAAAAASAPPQSGDLSR